MRIPSWAKIEGRSKIYWKMLSDEYERIGSLTDSTLPEFIKLCKNLARRDEIDDFISESNQSFLQETKFIDATGQEHSAFKESAYSKLSRDLDRIISAQMKNFRPTPKEKHGKKKGSEFFED